jgi:hypothetical protein
MIKKTINLARICIPYPNQWDDLFGYSCTASALTQNKLIYNTYKNIKDNLDDIHAYKDFYDILSAVYNIDLSTKPAIRPMQSWINWCNNDNIVYLCAHTIIKHRVLKECNTLVCQNIEEHDFLVHMYLNATRKSINGKMLDYKKNIPNRFTNLENKNILKKIQELALPQQQK